MTKVKEAELPVELNEFQSVESAYPNEIADVYDSIRRKLPVMVECDKEMTPYFFRAIRERLRHDEIQCAYLDGRPDPNQQQQQGMMPQGLIGTMITQLREIVRNSTEEVVVVLPHLDLLTTSTGGLTAEAKEVIPLLYENPRLIWLGFKDPSFLLPKVIDNLFPTKVSIIGIPRDRLKFLVTQKEAKKFGKEFNPYALYKFVSGVNSVRLRRVLSSIEGEDYPTDAEPAFAQVRASTIASDMQIPNVDMFKDIGGYKKTKDRMKSEIIDLIAKKDGTDNEERVKQIEGLIPRGIIFWGPPGTGKTFFAKAMATALGAAVQIVSGPELKSRWVGESEERIRQIFNKARQSAPSIIVFDELDAFASARGTYTGSGVEHSMVNQLLTEMDGFRKDELVFVVGTTNFVEILDPALLRPGRFEFHLEIPYPNLKDRKAIFNIYDKKFELDMSERALSYAVKRTGDLVEGTQTRYSGDHIQALCRSLARMRLRNQIEGQVEIEDIERAINQYLDRPELNKEERMVVATHEAGHAVVALNCENSPPIERISIQGDLGGALGYVRYDNPANKYVQTRNQMLDTICTLFGGRESEDLLLKDVSIGAGGDLHHATEIARAMVEELGLGGESLPLQRFADDHCKHGAPPLSEATKASLDKATEMILNEQRERAQKILKREKKTVVALRDLLLEKKVLDKQSFSHLLKKKEK